MKPLTQPTKPPLISQPISRQQPFPCLEPKFLIGWFCVWVDAAPCFRRSFAVEILVRSDVVVPVTECVEIKVELFPHELLPHPQSLSRKKGEVNALVELLFEGTEEAFDSTVLPRAAGISALVADAELF